MKKPIIFLLVLITNILFISAQKISKTELKDKIAGAWIGQMVGNIYGLPFENKFVDEPAPESRFPFGYTKNCRSITVHSLMMILMLSISTYY